MYKYILIPILLLVFIGYAKAQTNPVAKPSSVMFINGNPGVTQLGLVKFTVDEAGNKTGYKLMNMRWPDVVKIINLEPGIYGVTQHIPIYDKVVGYQTFTVGKEAMTIEFRELF